VFEALRSGAIGFLLRDTLLDDLLAAVRVVARGDALLAPSITRRLVEEFARRPGALSDPCPRAKPTFSPTSSSPDLMSRAEPTLAFISGLRSRSLWKTVLHEVGRVSICPDDNRPE
jgi:DNA-binding NarL/FixJ family response regulator